MLEVPNPKFEIMLLFLIIGVPTPEQYWSKCKMAAKVVTYKDSVPATDSDHDVKQNYNK